MKKEKIGSVLVGTIVHHYILFNAQNARAHRALSWSEKAKRALSTDEILSTVEGAIAFAKKMGPENRAFCRRSGVWEQGEITRPVMGV